MRALLTIGISVLLTACQSPPRSDAGRSDRSDAPPPLADGWTIEETMKVRDIDLVRISPDGRRVLFVVRSALLTGEKGEFRTVIHIANAGGTDERPLFPGDFHTSVAEWSPDGRWIAFASDRSGVSAGPTLWIAPSKGGTAREIDVGGTGVVGIGWAPDGRSIAFTMPAPASAAQLEAQARPDAPRVVGADQRNLRLWVVGVGPDGRMRERARVLSPDTLTVMPTVSLFGQSFDWSPDGTAIVYSASSDLTLWASLLTFGARITDVATGRTRTLVAHGALGPRFSPDGRSVAFLSTEKMHPAFPMDVAIISSSGGAARRLTPTADRRPVIVGWSRDASQILVTESRRTFTRLSALPVSGGPAVDIDPGDAVLGAVALDPSRTMVSFTRQTLTQAPEAYVSSLGTFRPVQVSHANSEIPKHALPRTELIQWRSADGAEIEGLLVYPMGYVPGERYPLVVAVRSGNVAFQQRFLAYPFMGDAVDYYPVTELALRGYAVLLCNSPRRSGPRSPDRSRAMSRASATAISLRRWGSSMRAYSCSVTTGP